MSKHPFKPDTGFKTAGLKPVPGTGVGHLGDLANLGSSVLHDLAEQYHVAQNYNRLDRILESMRPPPVRESDMTPDYLMEMLRRPVDQVPPRTARFMQDRFLPSSTHHPPAHIYNDGTCYYNTLDDVIYIIIDGTWKPVAQE